MFTATAAARIAHEVNRAYCQSIGDNSQPTWEDAPDWQKQSAVNGIRFHWDRLMRGEDPRPEVSHESWLAEKLATGWKYGPVKSPETKEHPCCVPYDKLPPEQKAKDHLFCAVARATFG